jgi:hypothetical protein
MGTPQRPERRRTGRGALPPQPRLHRDPEPHRGRLEIRGGTGPLAGPWPTSSSTTCEPERLADWETARALHGDDTTTKQLPRSETQRRADALTRIFAAAAATTPTDSTAPRYVHHIKWDQNSFQQMLAALAGGPEQRLQVETSICETLDGVPLAPTQAIVNAYLHEFRPVIVDSAGTDIT